MSAAMPSSLLVLGVDVHTPGAGSFEAVTHTLRAGHVNSGPFPAGRLADAYLTTSPDDHYDGGYFGRIDEFDHRYFKVPARLAASMDPYQRWCLLSSTRALHDAGLLEQVGGTRVGVYASCNQLQQAGYADLQRRYGVSPDLMAVLSSSVAARISHFLDLRGPAVVVDTACSSSLYALTVACADLRSGAVDTAVVTTANLYLDPGVRGTAAVDVVSPTSATRSFDAGADGVSVGEGVVTVVLRRAEDAGERVSYGTVESWHVGQDGRTATMAAPNPQAQADLIDAAWSHERVDVGRLGLLVSHGTGTAVGDAVELEALSAAGVFTDLPRSSVPLISAKANLGHLDAASGLLSVVVALGALSTGVIPPHPSFVAPSRSSDLVSSPFFVPDEPLPVATGRLAGLSSFGMTGTNVHVVVGAGQRQPGPTAELGLELRRHWFSPEGNTFTRAASSTSAALGRRTASFVIDARHDWEIAEHRVGGVPLMVGTGVHEMVAHLLRGAPYGLSDHDVVDLTMLGPLSGHEASIEVVATVDEESLDGEIVWRTEGCDWRPWVRFRLRPAANIAPLTVSVPSLNGLTDVPVHTSVGDDETVSVSGRWNVVTRLGVAADGKSGVLEMRVPPAFAAEAGRYDFYPPLLDAACNGLNALLVEDEVLLPWVDDRISYHVPQLRGERFTARIEHRETVRDNLGNVIVRVDADLWDDTGTCVLSVRGHRVKNRLDDRGPSTTVRVLGFDEKPQRRTGHDVGVADTVVVVPLHGAPLIGWDGPGRRVVTPEALTADEAQCRELLRGVDDVVIVGESAPDGLTVESDCYGLGQLLLALHSGSQVRTVTLLEPGSFGPSRARPTGAGSGCAVDEDDAGLALSTAHVRARAAAGYSLRTELRFDVAVLDAPAVPGSVELLRRWVPEGILWLDGADPDDDTALRSARFATTRCSTRPDRAGGRVLVMGASSGIGLAYAEWLVQNHPALEVIGCGRRTLAPDATAFRYLEADVTDPKSIERLGREVGHVDQIVMFAGETASGLLVTKARGDFEARMASKVRGPHHLAAAFGSCPDIVLVGSVAGYVGAMGQTEYAAANAYLTGLADGANPLPAAAEASLPSSPSPSLPSTPGRFRCLSLSGWSEIGMSRDLIDDLFVKTTPQEGLPMVHAFVTSDLVTGSLFTLLPGGSDYSPLLGDEQTPGAGRVDAGGLPAASRRLPAPGAGVVAAKGAANALPLTGTAAPRVMSSDEVHAQVLGAWERVLGDDEYADDVTFFEYGGDSVSVVSLCDELGRIFPDLFDVTTLFSCSTVADQSRWVQRSIGVLPDRSSKAIDISAIRHLLELNRGSR